MSGPTVQQVRQHCMLLCIELTVDVCACVLSDNLVVFLPSAFHACVLRALAGSWVLGLTAVGTCT
jgi:hypothetical protein